MVDVRGRLGAELRRFREDAGLSGTQVANALGWSQSKVSRVETGRFGASLEEVAALLDYYGAPEEVRAELLAAVARREGLEGAWVVRAGGPRRRQAELGAVETRVRRLRQYAPVIVPGLLQAPSYARAVAAALGFSDVQGITERRVARQEVFARAAAPYEVVIDARALLRWPAGRGVREEQLRRLLEVDPAYVDLRVLPLGTGSALALGGFMVYEFTEDGGDVVMVESQTADTYLSAETDVTAYGEAFDRLQRESLDADASRRHLEQALRE